MDHDEFERLLDQLARDPARGGDLNRREAEALRHWLEQDQRIDIRNLSRGTIRDGYDWLLRGTYKSGTFDAVGPMLEGEAQISVEGLIARMIDHLSKADNVLADLTGLTEEEQYQVLESWYGLENPYRIILLGLK